MAEENPNQDLVDGLTRFNGRGFSHFILKNQDALCTHTISPRIILSFLTADENIIAEAMAPAAPYARNLNLYHHIQRIDNPRQFINALVRTENERVLGIIRNAVIPAAEIEIREQAPAAPVGGTRTGTGETPGGSRSQNQSQRSGTGTGNEVEGGCMSRPSQDTLESNSAMATAARTGTGSGSSQNEQLHQAVEKMESYDCKNVRVLFINQKFDSADKLSDPEYEKNRRHGAEKDDEAIKTLFRDTLKMTLEIKSNVGSDGFRRSLEIFKRRCVEDDNDGCILILSTHGQDPHSLLMDDLSWINLETEVIQQFGSENFRDFIGKPKIFVFNACRDEAVLATDSTRVPPISYKDMLVVHSTIPFFPSYRHAAVGSWFIQTLCQMCTLTLDQNHEIRHLFRLVGEKVARDMIERQLQRGCPVPNDQVAEIRDRLFMKNFYLKPQRQ